MTDMLRKKGFNISDTELSRELGCPVVKIDGRTGFGVSDLMLEAERCIELQSDVIREPIIFDEHIDKNRLIKIYNEIAEIEKKVLHETVPRRRLRQQTRS